MFFAPHFLIASFVLQIANSEIIDVASLNLTNLHLKEFKEISIFNNYAIPIPLLEKYYQWIGPDAIFDILEEEFCHDKGHNVGRLVYSDSNDLLLSVKICRNRCTGACWHGVLMQYFENIKSGLSQSVAERDGRNFTDSDLYPYFQALCDSHDELADLIMKYYRIGDCYHSLGHAVMYLSEYDPFRASGSCKAITQQLKAYYCATGAHHEYALAVKSNRTATDLLFPCDLTNDFPAACYRACFLYKPYFRNKGHKPLAEICMAMEDTRQQEGCFHGYGLLMYRLALNGVVLLPTLCYVSSHGHDKITKASKHMCVEAVAGKLELIVGNEKKEIVCNQIQDMYYRKVCVESGNERMNKDPALYYSVGEVSSNRNNTQLAFRLLSIYTSILTVADIEHYYDALGPDTILSILESESKCAMKALNLGRVVHSRSSSIAEVISICSQRCAGGCFHGAVMQHFDDLLLLREKEDGGILVASTIHYSGGSKLPSNNPESIIFRALGDRFSTFCNGNITRFALADCHQSLGFAAMSIARRNWTLAAVICDSLSEPIAAFYCATGVYHIVVSEIHEETPAKQSATTDSYFAGSHLTIIPSLNSGHTPLYPCDATNYFPAACYRYLVGMQGLTVESCLRLQDTHQRLGCFYGLGLSNFNKVARGQLSLEAMCSPTGGASLDEMHMCVEGAVGGVHSAYGEGTQARVCASLPEGVIKIVCVAAGDKKMTKEPRLFYSVGAIEARDKSAS